MTHLVREGDLEILGLAAGKGGGAIRYFKGETYGVQLSLLRSDVQPGHGAPAHTHAYDELFVIHGGRGRFTIGSDSVDAEQGDIVVVPAGLPHGFTCIGDEPLRQISIHRSPVFAQTILPS